MPFRLHESPQVAFRSASKIMQETGAQSGKLEGENLQKLLFLTQGIPVMGHIGLTPQRINTIGGFITQGKSKNSKSLFQMLKQ